MDGCGGGSVSIGWLQKWGVCTTSHAAAATSKGSGNTLGEPENHLNPSVGGIKERFVPVFADGAGYTGKRGRPYVLPESITAN